MMELSLSHCISPCQWGSHCWSDTHLHTLWWPPPVLGHKSDRRDSWSLTDSQACTHCPRSTPRPGSERHRSRSWCRLWPPAPGPRSRRCSAPPGRSQCQCRTPGDRHPSHKCGHWHKRSCCYWSSSGGSSHTRAEDLVIHSLVFLVIKRDRC